MTTSMTHAEIQALFSGERREQRRYEIAKQYFDLVMVPDVGRYHPDKAKMEASRAVEYADALLAELERTK